MDEDRRVDGGQRGGGRATRLTIDGYPYRSGGSGKIADERRARAPGTSPTREAMLLLDLALSRSQADPCANKEVKELIRGALEAAKQEIAHLEDLIGMTRSADGGRGDREP